MAQFVGYTIGLECMTDKGPRLVKVEYSRNDSRVLLLAVSGRNLAPLGAQFAAIVSNDEFENRPRDAYDSTKEAIWALGKVGLSTAAH